jgi:hypothetical protein
MHLSPLFSSKKIVLSPLSPAGFFLSGVCARIRHRRPFRWRQHQKSFFKKCCGVS